MYFFLFEKYESMNQLFGALLYLIRSFSMMFSEEEFLSVISGNPIPYVSLCKSLGNAIC